MKKVWIVMFLFFSLTGMFEGARDIEDENYVLVLGMDENVQGGYVFTFLYQDGTKEEKKVLSFKGESFDEVKMQYDKMSHKNLEIGHVKAVLIGEGLLQADKKEGVLEELQKVDIPYLCYVYQAVDAKEILEREAAGQNWWCLIYPPLCIVDGSTVVVDEDGKEVLKEEVGEETYQEMLIEEKPKVVVKFKLYEELKELFGF